MSLLYLGQDNRDQSTGQKTLPDLNGTWIFDKSVSDYKVFGAPSYDAMTMLIVHNEPNIKITRRIFKKNKERKQDLSYYSDERGEANISLSGLGTIKSKTKWEGPVLVSTGVYETKSMGIYMKANQRKLGNYLQMEIR